MFHPRLAMRRNLTGLEHGGMPPLSRLLLGSKSAWGLRLCGLICSCTSQAQSKPGNCPHLRGPQLGKGPDPATRDP